MKCSNPSCEKETTNKRFCSRSCSAKIVNVEQPRRKTKKICTICSKPTGSWRRNRCPIHTKQYLNGKWRNRTIGEYRKKKSVVKKHPSWLHSHIRVFARSWFKHLLKLPCAKCGYDKHVELAHIKPISSFPDSALLSEVNSSDNIIQLCPNCHWEMDNL